jgi:hypothetical protein
VFVDSAANIEDPEALPCWCGGWPCSCLRRHSFFRSDYQCQSTPTKGLNRVPTSYSSFCGDVLK